MAIPRWSLYAGMLHWLGFPIELNTLEACALFKTGHSKKTDIGLELCTPDFDRLSVPVDAALVTGLSTIASISVSSLHSRYHLLGSRLSSGFLLF